MDRHDRPTDKQSLADLSFVFTAIEQVPVEQPDGSPCVPKTVSAACFSPVQLQPLDKPEVVCLSQSAFALIGVAINPDVSEADIAAMLSASKAISNSTPYAHCYAGHQFGMFAGQLGDGAATSIGEVAASQGNAQPDGVRCWELQFKGAGLTPYSRCTTLHRLSCMQRESFIRRRDSSTQAHWSKFTACIVLDLCRLA